MKIYITEREHKIFYSVVEQALLELKSIKEANPSEAIKHMEFICKILKEKGIDVKWLFKEDYKIIIQALHRLESIDNAEPSEALEKLQNLRLYQCGACEHHHCLKCDVYKDFNAVNEYLLNAQKEHNSLNLLMQELDCKDFADLRKYARCGYEKINKKYLKWEDLEFKKEEQTIKVLLNGERYLVKYVNEWFCGWCNRVQITNGIYILCTLGNGMKQFFNDLKLEVEE